MGRPGMRRHPRALQFSALGSGGDKLLHIILQAGSLRQFDTRIGGVLRGALLWLPLL